MIGYTKGRSHVSEMRMVIKYLYGTWQLLQVIGEEKYNPMRMYYKFMCPLTVPLMHRSVVQQILILFRGITNLQHARVGEFLTASLSYRE